MRNITISVITIALVTFLMAELAVAQNVPLPTRFDNQPFDIEHYTATLDLTEYKTKFVTAESKMFVRWNSDLTAPTFPFHLRGLTVDSVFVNNSRTAFEQIGTPASDTFHYEVTTTKPVSKNQLDSITVFYHGVMTNEGGTSPWGGVHYEDETLYALGVGFNNNYVSATQHWLACYDHPSDKATTDFTFIVPNDVVVASNGLLKSTTAIPTTNQHRIVWQMSNPASTYLLTFAVGPYTTLAGNTKSNQNVPYEYYVLPRDTVSSKISYSLVPIMVRTFEQLYGDYPFEKVGYVNTQRGAMEHQTMISLPVSVAQRKDTVNSTAAHELAHQWFGDCVSPVDFSHAWLTEAFATYSEQAWAEHLFGHEQYLKTVETNARTYINRTSKNEGVLPLYDFSRIAPSSNYPQTIYQKGAVVVAMMRAICGDEVFYATLQKYLQEHAYGTATTDDMYQAFKGAMGGLAEKFFQEWVYGRGWPVLKVEYWEGFAGPIVFITQTQQDKFGSFHTLPLGLRYNHHITGKLIDTLVIMSSDTLMFSAADITKTYINVGSSYRSLVEILYPTTVHDDNADADIADSTRATVYVDDSKNNAKVEFVTPNIYSELIVTDSTGRVYWRSALTPETLQIVIPLGGMANGAYYVNITGNGKSLTLPFMLSF
ncbi:MAG: M1 family metallopeptidase [Ignavibacteria bacterium]|nr:M1 family metallopeptidase [Ignavibacteria bacterium]